MAPAVHPLPHLLPTPRRLALGRDRLPLAGGLALTIASGGDGDGAPGAEALRRLQQRYQPRFDQALGRGAAGTACLRLEPEPGFGNHGPVPQPGDREDYLLEVNAAGAALRAGSPWGMVHGLERCLRLSGRDAEGPFLPALTIDDAPRLPWRGLLLDPARRFLPLPVLQRVLDGMAVLGLNVLHLHLNDDQGFRVESRRLPALHRRGGIHGFLARDEVHALVAAAAERGIRVVPELDVPGHAGALLLARPDLAAAEAPERLPRAFGPSRYALDPSLEATWAFLEELVADLVELFPDPWLHLGGDEVAADLYRFTDARRRRWTEERGLETPADVQAWFTRRMTTLLERHERRPVGWDETLHEDLPPSLMIQSWRGVGSQEAALAAGHDVLFSSGWYLDLGYPPAFHHRFDPAADAASLAVAERALAAEPELAGVRRGLEALHAAARVPAPRRAARRGRVLGGEACLWGELVDAETLDVRLWSRLAAVADRLWSPPSDHPAGDLHERIGAVLAHLEAQTACRPLSGQLPGLFRLGVRPAELAGVQTLLGCLEPVRWYRRLLGTGLAARLDAESVPSRPYTADTPLDRVVDLLPPESPALVDLACALDRRPVDDGASARLQRTAAAWRAAPAELADLTRRASAFAEIRSHMEALPELAAVLEAMLAGVEVGPRLERLRARHGESVAETELAALRVLTAVAERTA